MFSDDFEILDVPDNILQPTWRVVYRHVAKGWRFLAILREETELAARSVAAGLLMQYAVKSGDDSSNWEYVSTERWDGSASIDPPPKPRVVIKTGYGE